ncbi:MAG: FAD-binding oxidoreductase [Solirubrobacteraceae bacterium]
MKTTTALPTHPHRRLDDRLLLAGDHGYDEARTVWNSMIDRRPAAVFPCAGVADVRAAVRLARKADLEIGVRCGGHNIAGLSVPDGGLMIDLRPMGRVTIDSDRRRARVQGGALLGALDRAAQAHGLATTAGNISHTGVGGLALGGGMGWLARRHGLTCDNVVSYTLVTAEGDVLRVSAEERPDLFWGLRGGGGNFGVVTEFEFRLHPVTSETLSVQLSFAADEAAEVIAGWRELALRAPHEATFTADLSGGRVDLGYVWVGGLRHATRALSELRTFGRPTAERVERLSYLALQRRDDSAQGHAVRRYWKGHYLTDLPDAAIAALLTGRDESSPDVSLQAYGGAIAEVPDTDSAFSHRGAQFEYVAAMGWIDAEQDEARRAATRRHAARIEPFACGAYVNALSDEGASGVRRAYSATKLARLTSLKDAYDPGNVFHLNHNIAPSGQSTSTTS